MIFILLRNRNFSALEIFINISIVMLWTIKTSLLFFFSLSASFPLLSDLKFFYHLNIYNLFSVGIFQLENWKFLCTITLISNRHVKWMITIYYFYNFFRLKTFFIFHGHYKKNIPKLMVLCIAFVCKVELSNLQKISCFFWHWWNCYRYREYFYILEA